MGEHDVDTEDGFHEDIGIDHFKTHEEYDDYLWINDIAIIYLERDVEFTGFLRMFFFSTMFEMAEKQINCFTLCHL